MRIFIRGILPLSIFHYCYIYMFLSLLNLEFSEQEALVRSFLMPCGITVMLRDENQKEKKLSILRQDYQISDFKKVYQYLKQYSDRFQDLQDQIQCLEIEYIGFNDIGTKLEKNEYKCFKQMHKDISQLLKIKVNILSDQIQIALLNAYHQICIEAEEREQEQIKKIIDDNGIRAQRLRNRNQGKNITKIITKDEKEWLSRRFNNLTRAEKADAINVISGVLAKNQMTLNIDQLSIDEFRRLQYYVDEIMNKKIHEKIQKHKEREEPVDQAESSFQISDEEEA